MKNKLFISAIMALSLSGCLDLQPISEIGEDSFYSNDDEMKSALTACYNGLQTPIQYEWLLTDVRTDIARPHDVSSSNSTVKSIMSLDELEAYASIPEIETYWNGVYNNIYRCNMVLTNLSKIQNEEKRKNAEGEALFIRAYHYFNLVRLFGPVFIVTEPISAQEAMSYERSSVDKVYSFIEGDLKKIIDNALLPDFQPDTELGRATMLAARTLLGKMYLTLHKYTEAQAQLSKVEEAYAGYDLSSIEYKDVFSITNEMNKEIIFAVRFKAGNVGLGNPMGNWFAPLGSESFVISGSGLSWNYPTSTLTKAYTADDKRKDAVFAESYKKSDGTVEKVRYVTKYLSPVSVLNDGEKDVPVLRYADVLLMLAEIENELNGPTQKAVDYLNATVKRAGLKPYTISDFRDLVDFRLAVEKERLKEFAYENQRFYDLVRTGRYIEVMKNYYKTETDDKHNDELYYKEREDLMNGEIPEYQMLLPLPTSLLDVNPYITQNPGY